MFKKLLRTVSSRHLLWVVLAFPFVALTVSYRSGSLFYGEVLHVTGELSIRLIMIAMAATPLLLLFPGRAFPRWLMKNRRYFGVASFVYAAMHAVVYLEKIALIPEIVADAFLPEYLTGWLATIILATLAATSNDASVRHLKRAWKKLHRLVYAAAVLGFAHWLLVAFDPAPALAHIAVLAALEIYRYWKVRVISLRARR